MCGRFAFYSPAEATAALFGVAAAPEVQPRFNIAPTQYVAAIRPGEDEQRELVMLRWGLVPFWAKDPSIGNRMINARAETVAEKPSYRAAYRHRRCLVLADGSRHVYDDLFWCTGASAAPWVSASGLRTDSAGFLAVNDCLQSLDDKRVFGAGDIATQ